MSQMLDKTTKTTTLLMNAKKDNFSTNVSR
jgi:hypothetical protein